MSEGPADAISRFIENDRDVKFDMQLLIVGKRRLMKFCERLLRANLHDDDARILRHMAYMISSMDSRQVRRLSITVDDGKISDLIKQLDVHVRAIS